MSTFSDDFNFSSWLDISSLEYPYPTDFYPDSDCSPVSSALHTPEGVHPALPDVLVDTYPFHSSYGVSPQVLHEPFAKPSLHPNFGLGGGNSDDDADGDNESDDGADEGGSVYKESDDEDTYDDDYEEYVKSRRNKPAVSILRSLPFPNMPSSSLKRRRSSVFDDTSEERPAKRVTRTLPSSPTQSKPTTPVHAQSASPAPCRSTRRIRNAPPPRNIQAPVTCGTSVEALESLRFRCPVTGCGYRTVGRRIPDFKRHLKTHNAGSSIICTGVRLSDADRFRIDDQYAVPYVLDGDDEELHVGGCLLSFSRSDALMRHVNGKNAKCVHYKQKTRK
ncbi:hypothetical protein CVT25_011360 [Psilocybe cyanescens]|uniref:Uncharacterized protein n=1 Tax=Psilocybe cyanescens TaxID=93625 RepID=A0A409WGB8_PSICY|nr:hypothetical protein CVT25_011360 [Psilocybe cyanescens]